MPYDPLMRWESEGGAVFAANEGNDSHDLSQPGCGLRRRYDRHDPRVVQTDPDPAERALRREIVAR
jgi:hypothetical protein